MRVAILYRPNSEYARIVETYAHDLLKQHQIKSDIMSLDSREGAAFASLYDITAYPAIMALADDGQVLKDWTGPELPLMREVSSYVR